MIDTREFSLEQLQKRENEVASLIEGKNCKIRDLENELADLYETLDDIKAEINRRVKIALGEEELPFDIIKIGDRVRSFDFDGVVNCYVEGIVEEIGRYPFQPSCDCYKIRATFRFLDGAAVGLNVEHYYPPVNGIPKAFGGGVTNGVKKI